MESETGGMNPVLLTPGCVMKNPRHPWILTKLLSAAFPPRDQMIVAQMSTAQIPSGTTLPTTSA